ncbi:VOC family protein [Streptomyces sp. ODS28]|uniref:VOC family protein n=1 Tax=Streptomyces sp. ODS28 TaxID=3136688 RepID=UPI0031ECBBBD
MALGWKLVIDAADPHRLAAFWATALEYEVEDHSALIEQLLGAGVVDESLCARRGDRQVWRDYAGVRHPDDPYDARSGAGLGRRLLFQRVPEAAGWTAEGRERPKTPLHLDVHAGPGRRAEMVTLLLERGASFIREVKEPQGEWSVLKDPEGNVFCVA